MATTKVSRDLEQLRDEISLREASLEDARREHERGELSAEQFAAIERRERGALGLALEEFDALAAKRAAAPVTRAPRRRRRRWLALALGAFALAALVVLWSSLAPRQAGQSITGSISLSQSQRVTALLSEAEADVANGNVVAALSAYQQVLAVEPRNVVALTQTGWLDFSAGSADKRASLVVLGVNELSRALALAPKNAATRLYYAIVAASTPGERSLAIREFKIFLGLHPSVGQLAIATPFLRQLGLRKG